MSLFWRIFSLNAAGLVVATALLLGPVTVSTPVLRHEALILLGGLVVLLAGNAAVLRIGLTPLQRLGRAMTTADLLVPGARPTVAGPAEAAELIATYNTMLDRLQAERAAGAGRALHAQERERHRIARELHDVLAHSISVINVQAGVGLALLDTDPEQARTALTTIKAKSKEALGEVRQVLDTLRAPGDAPRTPAPGLGRLPELVEQAASAGLTVEVEGEPPALPPGTDLAAFRIVQEALTNVVRHSGSRHARVGLAREGGALRLRVDDDGPATGAEAGGSGNGLAGMRERAAALGGTIEAGPRPDGGFRVLALLPIGPDSLSDPDSLSGPENPEIPKNPENARATEEDR
ncbi:HAMP domain-containing sensor histidine kinase [Streptomyces rochei]|uniref:HAMP domain-containing sensor histidine kinase n=1 Tax=Streptomyces rochei TaxID=1928 RepID=UPI0022E996D0|nr:HAMP domain-containing sensor histidine kinase [Streptomyces rochei]